jgi:hypothetical protein
MGFSPGGRFWILLGQVFAACESVRSHPYDRSSEEGNDQILRMTPGGLQVEGITLALLFLFAVAKISLASAVFVTSTAGGEETFVTNAGR